MYRTTSIVLTVCLLLVPPVVRGAGEPSEMPVVPEVYVADRGEQPWQLLRYHWTVGSIESARTDYRMSMSMASGGEVMGLTMPMSLEFEATVTEVDEAGTARLEIVYTAMDVDVSEMTVDGQPMSEAMLKAMAAEFDHESRQLVGCSGWEVYDSRGRLLDWGIDAPEAFPEDLRSEVEEMSATPTILPEEPVGVGAIWNVATSFSESGLEVDTIEVNELLALEGDRLELGTLIDLDAGGGVAVSELGGDTAASVEDLTVHSEGSVDVDLGRVFAQASFEARFHMEMSTPDGRGGSVPAIMDMEMNIEIVPV